MCHSASAEISGGIRQNARGAGKGRQTRRRHYGGDAIRNLDKRVAGRVSGAHIRRGHLGGARHDIRGRFGQGRHAPVRGDIFLISAACLRQYNPRCGDRLAAGGAMHRPCRTGRGGRCHPPRCVRHELSQSHTGHDHCLAGRRDDIAQSYAHGA